MYYSILNNIKQQYDLSSEEEKFLQLYTKSFLSKNKDYLNIDLSSEKHYQLYTKIKELTFPEKKLENLEEATKLVIQYLKEKKRIILITDSDLDGSCCRGIATSFDLYFRRRFNYTHILEQYFANGHTHGVCFNQVDTLLKGDRDSEALIITADNGINNRNEILLIKEKYPFVQIIITDHHLANETDGVYDLVDFVLNPEATSLDTKSEITTVSFGGDSIKTSFSGGHTFYFLIKELVEQLGIDDEALQQELLLIALFSDIGDIINFGPDVMQSFTENIEHFKEMFFIDNYAKGLDSFNQFPNEHFNFKINEYLSKVITLLNSTRRTNSILLQYNSLNKEDFKSWMIERFEFDVDNEPIVISKKSGDTTSLIALMNEMNKNAKKIYEYFYKNSENRYCVDEKTTFPYSYIKEMVVFLLLSKNEHKNKNDAYFIEEAYNIINKMNIIKNALRTFIVEKELYVSDKFELFETYFSKKDGVLREILAIQAFIENNPKKSFLTLAQNQPNVINGSLRSKSVDFKELFNNHPKVQLLKEKYTMGIDIFGHASAAGIFFNKENITYSILKDFLTECEEILLKEGQTLTTEESFTLELDVFENLDITKMIEIIRSFFIIGPNAFIKPFKITISGKQLQDKFGEIDILTSKTGTKYVNKRDRSGNTYLLFPDGTVDFDEGVFESEVVFKYNSQLKKYYCELLLNVI